MSTLYSTTVTAIGGRNGSARSDDGLIDLRLSLPGGLGGKGDATNPEQLFAAGYAACFGNAVLHASRSGGPRLRDSDVEVAATVGLSPTPSGGFGLSVALAVTLAGIDQSAAEALVAAAHRICPYSNAVRGNIAVALSVTTR
ncbi:organic hydroperoxide resistance protein [Rhodospirillum centenum]|uniref:OsmC n=1 Tax=Rhodospirillum centenum (strain ATCC 51521 / SW) TaxID=414684 RepID=B6IS28_RHOCS|nr:organic hydroperoxide resistance protein [Rhodospirillum centenum]ACI98264.1 OsmC [Rhodospirillum centenum SW]